jgi:hypothetical protein
MPATTTTTPVPSTSSMANGGKPSPHVIIGWKLAQLLKKGAAKDAILSKLAYELQTGEVAVTNLTAKQARSLTCASRSGLAAERRAHKQANGHGPRVLYKKIVSDADVDTLITKVGPERVMAALDRYTQPTLFTTK